MLVGDFVRKVKGDYYFEGTVVAVFGKISGRVRLVVENADGVLFIFSPSQLERSDGTKEVPWHDRTEPLPLHGQVWASDGKTVWLIWADGKPLPEYATAVKVWSPALIPKPPNLEVTE